MRAKIRLCTALALALVLAACAGVPVEGQVAASCRGYASTLSSLAELRAAGDLSESQIDAVDDARRIANPICYGGIASTPDDMRSLSRALRDMSRIEAEATQ